MKKIYLLSLILLSLFSSAQNQFSKWYFGYYAGLDFSTGPPTVLTNSYINATEGVATISDNAGNFLFYSDGTYVMDATNTYMANGASINGDGTSTQAAVIVKQPGINNNYYIFTTSTGLGSNNNALYNIVDMNLAAGLGSVTVKNALMYHLSCEKQVAIQHCNGKDVWIVSHKLGTNEFKSFLLNSSGLSSTPVTTGIGNILNGYGVAGHLKVSPDGKKLAMATASASSPSGSGEAGFYLFDFDASSGTITNSLTILSGTNIASGCGPYGLEFSPDGTKLYGTTIDITSYSCSLYQWNVCAPSASAIATSQYSISMPNLDVGAIQKAIDGKLYIAMGHTHSLTVINNPNASGAAMGFSLNALSIAPNYGSFGLPNYINGYTHTVPSLFTNTLNCQNASFSTPPVPTFTSGCSATPYLPSNYVWDFGEPSAGAANSSTVTNPVHNYAATGTYSVTLIIYSACTNDTLKKTITVSTPGPAVSVAGNTVICKGEKYTYTASGATSYSWSTGASNSSTALSPTNTSVYTVTGTAGACTTAKSFTVTVNPCTGISTTSDKTAFTIFPNPFKDFISVEATASSELVITDLSGNIVLISKLTEGKNEIVTSELKSGIYLIQAKNGEKVWRGRFVKVE